VISQKHLPHENDACITNQGIEVTELEFFGQTKMLLDHLERELDIPALTVGADNFLVGQIGIRGQESQPVAVVSVANEYQLARQFAGERHETTGKDLRFSAAFFQSAVDRHQIQALSLKTALILSSQSKIPSTQGGSLCLTILTN